MKHIHAVLPHCMPTCAAVNYILSNRPLKLTRFDDQPINPLTRPASACSRHATLTVVCTDAILHYPLSTTIRRPAPGTLGANTNTTHRI